MRRCKSVKRDAFSLEKRVFSVRVVRFVSRVSDMYALFRIWVVLCLVEHTFSSFFSFFPPFFFFFCSVLFFSFFSLARVQPTRESWFRPGKICTDSSADLDPRAQKTAEEFWNTARVLSNTFIVTVFRLRNRRFNKFLDHPSFVINRLINRLINSFTDERDLLIRK